MATSIQVVFDAADPATLGGFWAEALHYVEQPPPEGFATWEAFLADIGVPEEEWDAGYAVIDPEGVGPRLYFQKVPEPKTVKNRMHLDLNVGGGHGVPLEQRREVIEAEAARLEALGATLVRRVDEQEFHIAMLDPEGNEFDVQ